MKRRYLAFCIALATALLSATNVFATLASDYQFSATTGTYTALGSGATTAVPSELNSPWGRNSVAGPLPIGFNFTFGCTVYSTFTTNAHGMIILGTTTSASYSNSLTSAPGYPIIAAFYDELDLWPNSCSPALSPATGVYYQTSGVAPNRVLTVDWRTGIVSGGGVYNGSCTFGQNLMNFQMKLYEGTNKIEFIYGSMYNGLTSSASIGIADSRSDFLSVTPGASASVSSTTDNSYNITSNSIGVGVTYTFDPTSLQYTGRTGVGNGGTATAANGATFFSGFTEQLGNRGTYTPLQLSSPCASAAIPMTMAITGPAAADYSFAATGTQSYSTSVTPGVPLIPGIHFTPTRTGLRTATLTITNTLNGSQRSYTLAASGSARIRYIGNIAEGGTPGMVDGDSLMLNVSVLRRQQASFRPMTVENFNFVPNFSSAPVPVTVTIDSAGTFSYQYKLIHPVTGALVDTYTKLVAPGDTFSPRIMFRANSAGKQVARMVVTNPDNENRVFYLAATSSAPAGRFEITGQSVIGSVQFTSVTSCVGEAATVFPMVITNTGFGDLVVSGFDVYRTDTTYRQGTPTVALVRDGSLNVVPSGAYGLFSGPVTVPLSSNPSAMPIVVPQGQSRTVLLSFIPNGPGKRWARVFMRTNAQNFNGYDTAMTPNVVEGMVNFDLVGTGIGSQLAANTSGLRLRTTVFPSTRVGDSVDVSIPIANSGACDLRINRGKLRIFSGDVNEFRLLTSLQTARIDATTGDYVLAPNTVDTLRVRFRPSRAGTRLATIWIQTNDSTIHLPGLTERGAYYLDLHGRGLAGLDGTELVLSPVAIGGSVDGVARLENSMNIAIGIDRIFFDGGDATEFTSVNWPTPPSVVLPGQKLLLGVRLSPPVGTQAGIRRTTIVIVTSSGDTVRVPVRGEAGTQTLVVSPTSLFDNISIAVGQASRQTLMISNTGTLPVRINRIEITGVDSAAYRLGMMPRRDLEPGQTEYVEVTFVPTTIGQTTAQIEVDASNGQSYTVTLGGTALRIRRDPVDDRPTDTMPGQKDTPARRDDRRPGLR